MARTRDVAILGAGIQGCSTALHCCVRELSVTVIEKDHAGRHASGVNAGGVRRLNRHPAEIPLSVASMRIWHGIEDLLGDDCGFRISGQVRVAETPADLEVLAARAQMVRDLGFTHEEMIGRDELYELVPALAPHCLGALIARDDGFASPARATAAFRRRAAELGAVFLENCPAETPRRRGDAWEIPTAQGPVQAKYLENTSGAWGDHFAAALGEPVPIEARAPMLMITDRLPPFITPVVGSASRYISFKQLDNGTVLIGGGTIGSADPARNTTRLDFAGLATLADTWSMIRCTPLPSVAAMTSSAQAGLDVSMARSAPQSFSRARRPASVDEPITRLAPMNLAICMPMMPTPELAPWISTDWPFRKAP